MEGDAASAARVKGQQTKHWNAVADGWAAWLDWTAHNFRPAADWVRDAAGWAPGARVLDVACGPGFPAFEAAAQVGPNGFVHATDISPAMIALASRRAKAAGLDNIEFQVMDAEQLRFGEESFDAVSNLYGLMFCPDLRRAVDEVRRVLKPRGRFAAVVWDEPSKSPFFSIINDVARDFLSLAPPDPEAPGPFRLAPPDKLQSLLDAGGFADVRVETGTMTLDCGSPDDYVQIFTDFAWKTRIASLSTVDLARFRKAVSEAARPCLEGGRLRLVATSIFGSGEKR